MKKLAIPMIAFAAPALAHEGHAVAPGPFGHDLAHLLIGSAAAAVVVAALAVRRVIRRRTERE